MDISKEELQKALSSFEGQTCWNVSSWEAADSLTLFLGKAVEVEVRHYPPSTSFEWKFGGQYELLVACAWRLDDENHNPILSSNTCDCHTSKTTASILVGDMIEFIEIIQPVWEMMIHFSSGKQLKAFCDYIPDKSWDMDGFMNCWCMIEKETYLIGPGKKIRKYKRELLISDALYDPEQIDMAFVISDKHYMPNETEEQQPEEYPQDMESNDEILVKTASSKEELSTALYMLKGLKCWNVKLRTGNMWSLSFSLGKAVKEEAYLTEDPTIKKMCYWGEYELQIDCTWRLDDENGAPVLSCYKSNEDEIETAINSLFGDSVESVEIESPIYEATIRFASRKQLRLFCDWVPGKGGIPNWYCDTPQETFFIGPGQSITKTKRELASDVLYDPEIDLDSPPDP